MDKIFYKILAQLDAMNEADAKVAAGTHRLVPGHKSWKRGDAELERIWGPDFQYLWRKPKSERPRCGALCRSGKPCRAKVTLREDGTTKGRCRMHGGLSTGPRTDQGRRAIAESNRRRAAIRAAQLEADPLT